MTERLAQIPHQQDPLERLNALIDWVFPRLPPKVRMDDQLIPACPCARFWTAFPEPGDPVPDQNTVREFREALQKVQAFGAMFEVFNLWGLPNPSLFEARGLKLKMGKNGMSGRHRVE